jgi:lysophospholipase L1-like esterase
MLVAGLVASLVTVVVPTAGAAAAAQPEFDGGGGYLALGDSVAFGYRPPEVTTVQQYENPANFVGYPEVLGRLLHVPVANTSCPGETTGSMIDATAQSNGCENALGSPSGYRTEFPLHVGYTGAQLDYAVRYLQSHPDTRLVTIDIGANDLFICEALHNGTCAGADFQATVNQVSQNLTTIMRALRDRAHYRHKLVLVSYYTPNYTDTVQVTGTKALNAALAAVTARFDGVVADGFAAFQAAAESHDGDACAAGLLVALPSGGCNIHPSRYGHQVLAGAILASLFQPTVRR